MTERIHDDDTKAKDNLEIRESAEILRAEIPPSPLETEESQIVRSAAVVAIASLLTVIGLLSRVINGDEYSAGSMSWLIFIGSFMGLIGFLAMVYAIRVERAKLAAHMYRSAIVHSILAALYGDDETMLSVKEMWEKEEKFVKRALGALRDIDIRQFAETLSAQINELMRAANAQLLESMRRLTTSMINMLNPFYMLTRASMTPYTLWEPTFLEGIGGALSALLFAMLVFAVIMLIGLVSLAVTILVSPILVYMTSRAFAKHAEMENRIRAKLGLDTILTYKPRLKDVLLSIVTLGLYLPFYVWNFTKIMNEHIRSH